MRGSGVGLTDTLKNVSATYRNFISFLDYAFASLIIAPAVVTFWRSVWELMGVYVCPQQPVISALISLAIGFVGHVIFCVYQNILQTNFHPNKHRILYYTVSRIYTILFGIACVNSWRGSWLLLDMYTRFEKNTVITTTLFSITILVLTRTLRNVSAPPFVVVYDVVHEYFTVPTMFRASKQNNCIFYLLDCVFSVFIIGSLVIIVWRGSWVMLDLFFYTNDFVQSSWNSLILGYVSVYISYSLQTPMRWLYSKANTPCRLIMYDLYLIFSFFGTVNLWRGVWNLLNIYFLPDDFILGCWITFSFSLILLILLKCSNSLLVRGVYIDAEEPSDQCITFPIFYLRTIIEYEHAKKQFQNLDLEALLKKLRPHTNAVRDLEIDIIHTSTDDKNNNNNHVEEQERFLSKPTAV